MAAVMLTPFAKKTRSKLRQNDYVILLSASLSGAALAPSLFFFGLNQTTASDASILVNGEVLFSVILAIAFFKEKIKPAGYIAIMLALIGTTIVATDSTNSIFIPEINSGNLFVIGSTMFWPIDNNLTRLIASRMNIPRIIQIKSLIGGSILLVLVSFLGISFDLDTTAIIEIIILGTIGFGASLYFFIRSLSKIGTIRTVLIFSLSSVFGMVFSVLFLGEQIQYYQMLAVMLLLSGIYLINRS